MNKKQLIQCNSTIVHHKLTINIISKIMILKTTITWLKSISWLKLITSQKIKSRIKKKGKMVKNCLSKKLIIYQLKNF